MKKYAVSFVALLSCAYVVCNDYVRKNNATLTCAQIVMLWMQQNHGLLNPDSVDRLYQRCEKIKKEVTSPGVRLSCFDSQGFVHSKFGSIVLYPIKSAKV